MDYISKISSKSSSKKNVTETIKNSMVKVSSFLNMCSSKDSFENIIDTTFNDNEILDNFKSISNSCDTIIQNEYDNIKPQIEESHDISDVSTNDTLYSIKEEETKENVELIEEETKENVELIEEETKENVELIEEEAKENVQIIEEVKENIEIIEEEAKENVELIEEEKLLPDEPKKKKTYKSRKKKSN
jgi:hypothetical protein